MNRVLIATFLAALAVSAWDYVFWQSELVDSLFSESSGDSEIMRVLEKHLDSSGEYLVGEEATDRELRTGEHNYAEISFTRGGPPWFRSDVAGRMMVVSFLTFLPLAVLLFVLGPRLPEFSTRFLMIAVFGAGAAIWSNGSYALIQGGPWALTSGYFFYESVSWCIGGAIIAKIVRPEETSEAAGTPDSPGSA